MSQQSAIEFLSKVEENPYLKEKLEKVDNPEDWLQLVKEKGYKFTAEDVEAVVKAAESEELSEDELTELL